MADEQLRLQATVVDQFSRPLTNLKNQLREIGNVPATRSMAHDWKNIGGEIARVNLSLRNQLSPALSAVTGLSFGVGSAFAGVAAGLTAAATGLRSFGSTTQALTMFSRETGIAADSVRAFNALGERFGTNSDTMQNAMKALASNMFDLRRRWGQAYGELKGMNLGDLAEDLAKSASNEEAMGKAFSRIGRIADPEARRRVSTLLFGTADIGAIAAMVGGDLQKVLAEIKQRQGSITPEMERAAGVFEKNLSEIRESMDSLRIQALGPLIGEVNKWWAAVDKPGLMSTFNEGLKTVSEYMATTKRELEGIQSAWERFTNFSTPKAVDDPRGNKEGRATYLRQEIQKLEAGDIGLGGAERPAEVQRRIDKLNDELRQLTDELKKQGSGANAQKSSFAPSGGMGGLIQQASLGGFGGGAGRIFGGPGGGTAGLGGVGGGGGSAAPVGAPAASGAPSPFRGGQTFSSTAPQVMGRLMRDFSLTREQAAGIVGNLGHESAGFTAFQEKGKAFGTGGAGWAQWTGPRRRQFIAWAAKNGLDPRSSEVNYGFLRHELQTTERRSLEAVRRQSSVGGATVAFENAFERSGVKAYGNRLKYANDAFKLGPADEPTGVADKTGRAFGNRMMGLPPSAQPQKVEGSASLDITINGIGPNYKARTSMDGMFKDVNLNKGRSMAMAEDI